MTHHPKTVEEIAAKTCETNIGTRRFDPAPTIVFVGAMVPGRIIPCRLTPHFLHNFLTEKRA